jgi:hypothetical protein
MKECETSYKINAFFLMFLAKQTKRLRYPIDIFQNQWYNKSKEDLSSEAGRRSVPLPD